MKFAMKFLLLFIIFSILFVLPSMVLPIPLDPKSQSGFNPVMLLVLLLVDLSCMVYLIKRLNLWGIKLYLAVALVFWGLQTFMTQIETWYFRAAMPAITDEVLLKLFLNPFITTITFVPVAILTLGKWNQPDTPEDHPNRKPTWKFLLALSITYVIIYFLFGHFVAWQFEKVRTFYSGSPELLGFTEQFQHTLHTYNFILPFQVFRGFLWLLCGLPLVLYLKGSRTEKVLACVFMYAVLTSVQLIIDNPFMPTEVRIAHLLEVSTSNGLFGLLTGWILCRQA